MRAGFGRHTRTLFLGLADQIQRLLAGNMAKVQSRAGEIGHDEIERSEQGRQVVSYLVETDIAAQIDAIQIGP